MARNLFVAPYDINSASSRYRVYWPAKYLEDNQLWTLKQVYESGYPIESDTKVIVFQKFGHPAAMKFCHNSGIKVVWDICDPVYWFLPDQYKDILENVDIITGSSKMLFQDLKEQYDITQETVYIPDAFDFEHYSQASKYHRDREDGKLRLIWFGHQNNRFALLGNLTEIERLANVEKLDITLMIMDGEPKNVWNDKYFEIRHIGWSLDGEVETIASQDLAFLPAYPGKWGKLKSDNKSVHAGLCGLHTYNPQTSKASIVELMNWGADEIDEGWLKEHDARVVSNLWKEVLES